MTQADPIDIIAPATGQIAAQHDFLRAALARHITALLAEGTSAPTLCDDLEAMGLAYIGTRGPAMSLAMHGIEVRGQTRHRVLTAWVAEVTPTKQQAAA